MVQSRLAHCLLGTSDILPEYGHNTFHCIYHLYIQPSLMMQYTAIRFVYCKLDEGGGG